jgi:FAD:protein FMN transferase
MKKLEFYAMGCHMLAALDSTSQRAVSLLQQVPEWFELWEQSLSRFRENSELSQLNHQSETAVKVSETLWNVFQTAVKADQESSGLVTPVVLDALEAIGYDRSFENLATGSTTNLLIQPQNLTGRLKEVEADPATLSLKLPTGLHLDFGGTAKGWAAHQAARRLSVYGPTLVNAGGDIAVSSLMQGGQPWQVGITDPAHPDANLAALALGRCGVATSGRDFRHWQQGGVPRHHIIDPRTGLPAETNIISATIVAPTVMEAEMAAKTVFILGSQKGLGWLDTDPLLAGFLVLEDGKIVQTKNMQNLFWRY